MPFLFEGLMEFFGRQGSGSLKLNSVPYFSASEAEAKNAILRVKEEDLNDLLIFSAQNGDLLTLRALLDKGLSPDVRGGKKNRPALHWAIYSQHFPVVYELVRRGVTIDAEAFEYAKNTNQKDIEQMLRTFSTQK